MPRPTELHYLEPRYDCDGGLLHYMTTNGSHQSRTKFISPEDVPQPHRGAGYFECKRERRGPWVKLIPIKRVDGAQPPPLWRFSGRENP